MRLALLSVLALAPATCAPCSPTESATSTPASSAAARTTPPASADLGVSSAAATTGNDVQTLTPGLVVERRRGPPAEGDAGADATVVFARIDPRRFAPRLLTAAEQGARRTAPAWAKEFGLVAVINASMYAPDGRSVSLLVDDGRANNPRDDRRFGGVLGLEPRRPERPPVVLLGRGCPGDDVEALRNDYRLVVANYRLLDCAGRAIAWSDEKSYSAAAIGVDAAGNVVLIHSRAPHRMRDFALWLARPEQRIAAAVYVEGGPEASLYAAAGGQVVEAIGSYETGFREDDDNRAFWELPNVIGFATRTYPTP